MMGRIIYKGRRVSHVYLWVTIEFREVPAATPAPSGDSPPFVEDQGARLYWDEEGSGNPLSIFISLSKPF
jgi:hypothetical protein